MAGRRGVRGFLVGAAATGALFTLSMPAIVSADGGQTGVIHACVFPQDPGFVQVNVAIVGPNEECPLDATPAHWPALDQPNLDSPDLVPLTKASVQPSAKVNKKLYKPLGIKVRQMKIVTETLGPSQDIAKQLTVSCPGSHPFVLSGQSSVVEPALGPGTPWPGYAVGLHAWHAEHGTLGKSPGLGVNVATWTLRVDVFCAKVAKRLGA